MAKEIGQIKVSRTENGLRIDISGDELGRAFCCCCCGPCCCEDKKSEGSSKDKSESSCCSS